MKAIEKILKTRNLTIKGRAGDNAIGGSWYDSISGKTLNFIFSNQLGWEHLSVSMPSRTPSWDQMCRMKDIFWDKDECCVQYHPKEEDYVNNHPHCLHIWKPVDIELPTPPSILVGFRNDEEKNTFLAAAKAAGIAINPWDFKK